MNPRGTRTADTPPFHTTHEPRQSRPPGVREQVSQGQWFSALLQRMRRVRVISEWNTRFQNARPSASWRYHASSELPLKRQRRRPRQVRRCRPSSISSCRISSTSGATKARSCFTARACSSSAPPPWARCGGILIASVGLDAARRLLFRFGFASGHRDAVSMRAVSAWDDPLDGVRVGAQLLGIEGAVHADIVRLSWQPGPSRFDAESLWRHSYEAEQHLLVCGTATAPVCWTLCGYVSGFASACVGREIHFRETQCAAVSGSHCVVAGKDADGWGEDGGRLLAEYRMRCPARRTPAGAGGPFTLAAKVPRNRTAAARARTRTGDAPRSGRAVRATRAD